MIQFRFNRNDFLSFISYTLVLFGWAGSLYSQTTTTTLKNPEEIREFLEATDKIRCICLPSLPIQSCSYNMCSVSAYLKTFIENRIKDGMKADEIVERMQSGFGDSVAQDPVFLYFLESGNQGMVDSIKFGFGEKILAKPSSWGINLTLAGLGFLGLFGIYFYIQKTKDSRISNQISESLKSEQSSVDIEKQIRSWEERI